jgi:hypothetical protein
MVFRQFGLAMRTIHWLILIKRLERYSIGKILNWRMFSSMDFTGLANAWLFPLLFQASKTLFYEFCDHRLTFNLYNRF